MTAALTLDLPEPPSANRYWRHARGRTYRAQEADRYVAAVRAAVLQLPAHVRRALPLTGPVAVRLEWHRSRAAGDLDNRIKQPLDALTVAGVWGDDAQIVRLEATRHESPRAGRLVVTINAARERQEDA